MSVNGQDYYDSLMAAQRKGLSKLYKAEQVAIHNAYDRAFRDAYKGLIRSKKFQDKREIDVAQAAYVEQIYQELQKISNEYNQKISTLTESFHSDLIKRVINKTENDPLYQAYMKNVRKATQKSVKALIKGNIYKDGKGLSERLWNVSNNAGQQINEVIQSCVASGMPSVEMAQVLQDFGKEGHRTWDNNKIREKLGGGYTRYGALDYEALRLARTTNTHLNQLNTINAAKENPYMNAVIYRSSHSDGRVCSICRDRDGKVYPLNKVPFDHPNGMCHLEPTLAINGKPASLEDIGTDIGKWIRGEPNSGMMDKKYPNLKTTSAPPKKPTKVPKEPKKPIPKINKGELYTPEERANRIKAMEQDFITKFKHCPGNTRGAAKHAANIVKSLKLMPNCVQDMYLYSFEELRITHGTGGACYWPGTNKIELSLGKISKSPMGPYCTFFHEWGHMIDDNLKWEGKWKLTENGELHDICKQDYEQLYKNIKNKNPDKDPNSILTDRLCDADDTIASVSDIYGGLTDGVVEGYWGHKQQYWHRRDKRAEVSSEAWADILEGMTNAEQEAFLDEYLPQGKQWVLDRVMEINEQTKKNNKIWKFNYKK